MVRLWHQAQRLSNGNLLGKISIIHDKLGLHLTGTQILFDQCLIRSELGMLIWNSEKKKIFHKHRDEVRPFYSSEVLFIALACIFSFCGISITHMKCRVTRQYEIYCRQECYISHSFSNVMGSCAPGVSSLIGLECVHSSTLSLLDPAKTIVEVILPNLNCNMKIATMITQ